LHQKFVKVLFTTERLMQLQIRPRLYIILTAVGHANGQ